MIKFGAESPVECGCGQPAIRRTVQTSHGMVSYDTHAAGLDSDHLKALGRLDRFHEKLAALALECRGWSEEERELESGKIIAVDFDTVHPDACSVRIEIVPMVTIRAWGLMDYTKLPPRKLKSQTAARLLAEVKATAGPALIRLKTRFDKGNF